MREMNERAVNWRDQEGPQKTTEGEEEISDGEDKISEGDEEKEESVRDEEEAPDSERGTEAGSDQEEEDQDDRQEEASTYPWTIWNKIWMWPSRQFSPTEGLSVPTSVERDSSCP
ncbi:prothymosin alpha-B-like isoform X2 [Perca flavescens]|uniref:prothymosin alpha-B-like isoform X2 n=1 Tax=Perca flavescens TaxID=8167 RepID=UPI00106E3B10|nr:prothymosin alpha-B-like isoform X2 [Perca flavescens]